MKMPCFSKYYSKSKSFFTYSKSKSFFTYKKPKLCLGLSRYSDSNRRPTDYKSVALPTELYRHTFLNHISEITLAVIHHFNQTHWISPRPISSCQLNALQHLHLSPIYLVLFKGSYSCDGISHLEVGFTLRCLQRLSIPNLPTLRWD